MIDDLIFAAFMIAVMLGGMRWLYGYWAWQSVIIIRPPIEKNRRKRALTKLYDQNDNEQFRTIVGRTK